MSQDHRPPPPLEERHPLSRMVHEIATSLPGAVEEHPWGDIVYKVKDKMFVCTSASGGGVTVKANPSELDGLLGLPGITRAAYVGRYGWIQVEFDDVSQLPFVEGLIRVSYELVTARAKGRSVKK